VQQGLAATDIVVRFGGLVALDGVSLQAEPNRITGLIGPNGAGKTTMFNVCFGFQEVEQGTVTLDGEDITRVPPTQRAKLGMGRTFQRMELFGSMTVRENIALAAESLHVGRDPLTQLGIRGRSRKVSSEISDATDELIDRVGLRGLENHLASEISTGQGRLVELARALARRPRILLLDEPTSGLDVAESNRFGQLLVELVAESGIGIFIIEHDMSVVLKICDWIHVLDFGRPLMAGTPDEVRASDEVRNAYLGKSDSKTFTFTVTSPLSLGELVEWSRSPQSRSAFPGVKDPVATPGGMSYQVDVRAGRTTGAMVAVDETLTEVTKEDGRAAFDSTQLWRLPNQEVTTVSGCYRFAETDGGTRIDYTHRYVVPGRSLSEIVDTVKINRQTQKAVQVYLHDIARGGRTDVVVETPVLQVGAAAER
jgi:ABC-type branched-subunit amino acid transport system ATPase component